jgi:hypothetical protein
VEDISFHVYKYKVSLRKDSKDHRQLELVQKQTKIGEPVLFACPWPWAVPFHQLHAGSALLEGEVEDHAR